MKIQERKGAKRKMSEQESSWLLKINKNLLPPSFLVATSSQLLDGTSSPHDLLEGQEVRTTALEYAVEDLGATTRKAAKAADMVVRDLYDPNNNELSIKRYALENLVERVMNGHKPDYNPEHSGRAFQ